MHCFRRQDIRKDSKKISTADVTQAKRHKTWIRNNVNTLRKDATIYTVMISNSESIEDTARIHAKGIYYCNRKDFCRWANTALNSLRTCNTMFIEIGDSEWRFKAQEVFDAALVTPLDFIKFITQKPLDKI